MKFKELLMRTPYKSCTRLVGVLALGTLLSACTPFTFDNPEVRTGPQAVHPSPSPLAQGTAVQTSAPAAPAAAPVRAAAPAAPATGNADAEALFAEYCLNKASAQDMANAIAGSGRFTDVKAASRGGARAASYTLRSNSAAKVTVVSGSPLGLVCRASVNGTGPSLYLDGNVIRD